MIEPWHPKKNGETSFCFFFFRKRRIFYLNLFEKPETVMPDSAEVSPRPKTVPPKPAASLVVLCDGAEVLMGMRGAGHRFMPNRLVFPG